MPPIEVINATNHAASGKDEKIIDWKYSHPPNVFLMRFQEAKVAVLQGYI